MDMTAALLARAATLPDVPVEIPRPRVVSRSATVRRPRRRGPKPVNGRVYKVTVGGRTRFVLSAREPEAVVSRARTHPMAYRSDLRVSGRSREGDPYLLRFLSVDPDMPDEEGRLPDLVPPCKRCGHDESDHRRGACASWACVCV